jgi:orotidine-5'-phosphate decarboxylase
VKQARVLPGTKAVTVHPLPPTGPAKMITEAPKVLRVEKLHAIKGGTAQQKLARDAAQLKAICVATNNAPTGLPASVCKPTASPANH